jgi:copper chaperone CopZ
MIKEPAMTTIELNVPTVHCTACKLNIEESLDDLAAVAGSVVDLEAKRVRIQFDPLVVEPAAITAAIEAAGHPVA